MRPRREDGGAAVRLDTALPVQVRRMRYETDESYSRRLRDANGLRLAAWRRIEIDGREVQEAASLKASDGSPRAGQRLVIDPVTQCTACVSAVSERFGCVRCAIGERVELAPNDGPRVCRRHRLWIGPGTSPHAQVGVDHEVMRADRKYRRLRRRGHLEPHLLLDIEEGIKRWSSETFGRSFTSPELFTYAVDLAGIMMAIAGSRSSQEVDYMQLRRAVEALTGSECSVTLVDHLWMLIAPAGIEEGSRQEHFAQLRTSSYPRHLHLHRTQFVGTRAGLTREGHIAQPSLEGDYVCFGGHPFRSSVARLARPKKANGCRVCSHREPLKGFNTITDLMPELVDEWDYDENGELRPDEVLARSQTEVAWVCPLGHRYPKSPSARWEGAGCSRCTNREVDDEFNSLRYTHPQVADRWHPTLNGSLTPADIVAGAGGTAWWACATCGSDYERDIASAAEGYGCFFCSKRKINDATSLAGTHPHLINDWAHDLNGGRTPWQVSERTQDSVWWRCATCGYEFEASIRLRARGSSCRGCKGTALTPRTSLAAMRPDIAAQLDPELNDRSADQIHWGSNDEFIWRCDDHGHLWPARVFVRTKQRNGCPYCTNRWVLEGFNDMATTAPWMLRQWDWEENGSRRPQQVLATTTIVLNWICAEMGHTWPESGQHYFRSKGVCRECRSLERSARSKKAQRRSDR